MVIYADTSFLVSLYGRDTNSARAQTLVMEFETPLIYTPFQRHEARNAVRLACFRREITAPECQAVLAAIEMDKRSGVLAETPVAWAEVYDVAEELSAAHTETLGTRAADILHVANAAALGATLFLSFDTRQKALAAAAGLRVMP